MRITKWKVMEYSHGQMEEDMKDSILMIKKKVTETFIYGNLIGYGGGYPPDMIALEQQITEEMQAELQAG